VVPPGSSPPGRQDLDTGISLERMAQLLQGRLSVGPWSGPALVNEGSGWTGRPADSPPASSARSSSPEWVGCEGDGARSYRIFPSTSWKLPVPLTSGALIVFVHSLPRLPALDPPGAQRLTSTPHPPPLHPPPHPNPTHTYITATPPCGPSPSGGAQQLQETDRNSPHRLQGG